MFLLFTKSLYSRKHIWDYFNDFEILNQIKIKFYFDIFVIFNVVFYLFYVKCINIKYK